MTDLIISSIIRLARGNEAALRILEYIAWEKSRHDATAIYAFLDEHKLRGIRLTRLYAFVLHNHFAAFNAAELADTLRRNHDIRLPLEKKGGEMVTVLEYMIQ